MEIGKNYIFYTTENQPLVGEYVNSVDEEGKIMVFKLKNGGMRVSKNVHDELDTELTLELFYKVIKKWFRGITAVKEEDITISHKDYEFNISIPRYMGEDNVFGLDRVEMAMDNILEDFWSAQLHELEHNNITVTRNTVEVSFRVHDVHEAQFRFNEEGK